MQKSARVWLGVGCAGMLAIAIAAVVWLGIGTVAESAEAAGPLAAVLLPDIDGSELVVADLAEGTVVRRIGLRSTVTDIAVDASSGLVVCAQAGGLGSAADNAISIVDVRSGEVRYVELPTPDPGDVVCLGGRAFVQHSIVETSGTVFTAVDVAAARVVAQGHVPGPPGLWTSAVGAVWSVGEDAAGRPVLRRIDPGDLRVSERPLEGARVTGLGDAGGRLLVLGASGSTVVDPGGGSVVATVPGAGPSDLPPRSVVQVGNCLALCDWSGDEPESRVVRLLDAATLGDLGALTVDGVPCAIAAFDDRLLVVDREHGRLLAIDPETGRTLLSIDLGRVGPVYSDVVVVDGGA